MNSTRLQKCTACPSTLSGGYYGNTTKAAPSSFEPVCDGSEENKRFFPSNTERQREFKVEASQSPPQKSLSA